MCVGCGSDWRGKERAAELGLGARAGRLGGTACELGRSGELAVGGEYDSEEVCGDGA